MANKLLSFALLSAAFLMFKPVQAITVSTKQSVILVNDEYERAKKIGDGLFAQGNYEQAEKFYKNCLEAPGFAKDVYAKSRIELCNKLLTLRKQAANALNQNKGLEAMELYQQVLVANPSDLITKVFITEYWTTEGNKFFNQKNYVEAKTRYEQALKYAQSKDNLQIQIQSSERFIQIEAANLADSLAKDKAAKLADSLAKVKAVIPITGDEKIVGPVPYEKPLTGLKIAVGVVGVAAAVQAVLTRSGIQSKLDKLNGLSATVDPDGDGEILTSPLYEQWRQAYGDAKDAKAKESMVMVYTGVAVVAAVAETVLLLRKRKRPAPAKGFSWQSAPTGVGLSVRYTF